MGGSRRGLNTLGVSLKKYIFSYKGDAVLLIFIWIGHFIFPIVCKLFCYLLLLFPWSSFFRCELHPLEDQTLVGSHVANDGGFLIFFCELFYYLDKYVEKILFYIHFNMTYIIL